MTFGGMQPAGGIMGVGGVFPGAARMPWEGQSMVPQQMPRRQMPRWGNVGSALRGGGLTDPMAVGSQGAYGPAGAGIDPMMGNIPRKLFGESTAGAAAM
jgi:hypothetical protein